MKTRILVLAALITGTTATAQQMTYEAGKTTFGLRAGVNFSTINGKYANGAEIDNSINTGFHAGLNAEIPIGTGFYLQPGVLYSQKGAEFKTTGGNDEIELTYIEVPVNLVYKPILGTGRMLLGFGPYAAFGLTGTVKNGSVQQDVEFTKNYDASVAKPQYKGIDAGANLLAGYEFANKVSFQVNAQLGLAQLTPGIDGNDNPTKQKNTGFGVSLGYRF